MPVFLSRLLHRQVLMPGDPLIDASRCASDIGITAGGKKRVPQHSHVHRDGLTNIKIENISALSLHLEILGFRGSMQARPSITEKARGF